MRELEFSCPNAKSLDDKSRMIFISKWKGEIEQRKRIGLIKWQSTIWIENSPGGMHKMNHVEQDYLTKWCAVPEIRKFIRIRNSTEEAYWRLDKRKRGRATIADTIPHEFARRILAPEHNLKWKMSLILQEITNNQLQTCELQTNTLSMKWISFTQQIEWSKKRSVCCKRGRNRSDHAHYFLWIGNGKVHEDSWWWSAK